MPAVEQNFVEIFWKIAFILKTLKKNCPGNAATATSLTLTLTPSALTHSSSGGCCDDFAAIFNRGINFTQPAVGGALLWKLTGPKIRIPEPFRHQTKPIKKTLYQFGFLLFFLDISEKKMNKPINNNNNKKTKQPCSFRASQLQNKPEPSNKTKHQI